jgi:hypothetical protein
MQLNEDELRGLIAEAKADDVGLWMILAMLRETWKITDLKLRRVYAINVVRQLLNTGEVVAAQYSADRSGSYDVWNMPPDSVIARIESEWDQLGREPNVGEIVLFIGKPSQ